LTMSQDVIDRGRLFMIARRPPGYRMASAKSKTFESILFSPIPLR
jgi:hypothetical protein